MNLDNIGRWLTLFANVGVIAGIVFLGIELRQNNELLAVQARHDREEIRRTAFSRYVENPELVRVTVKDQKGEPLTAEEEFLLNRGNQWTLWDWANIFREVQEGLLDENALGRDGWRNTFRRNQAAMQATWDNSKNNLPDDFVEWMEENVVNDR